MRSRLEAGVLTACALIACGGDASRRAPDEPEAPASDEPEAPAPEEGASDCPPTYIPSAGEMDDGPRGNAVDVMRFYCARCHSPEGAQRVPQGPSNVFDFNLMIDEAFVVDCSADLSPILISMRANEMPPPGDLPFSVFPFDLDHVVRFIEFQCTDEEKACAISPSVPGCDDVLSARRERRCSW